HCRVPGTSSVILVIPGQRMRVPHVSSRIALFVESQQHLDGGIEALSKVVPLVESNPFQRQTSSGCMSDVGSADDRVLKGRMTVEVSTHEFPVPRPLVFGIRRGMDTDEPSAA